MENISKNIRKEKTLMFIIPTLEIGGGAERIASVLSKKLSSYYNLYVLTFYNQKETYPIGGNHISFYSNAKFWKKILLPIQIYKFIKKISPDLIISFIDYVNSLMILIKLFFRIKVPLILANHTNPLSHYQESDRYLNILIPVLYSLKYVNKIITIANYIKEILNKYYRVKSNKIKIIYNGIDIEDINRLKEEKIREKLYRTFLKDKSYFKFITMGRLISIKGHKYLINAFANVKKENPKSKLFILGEGPLKKTLIQLAKKKKVNDDIFFLGIQSNPYKYLHNSDIFILPSLIEGLPMSIIEAMACGLPIIATKCKSGIEEILEDGKYGILVNRKDSSALAREMIRLIKKPSLRKKYSELSLQRVQFFDIKKIIKNWVNIIEKEIALKQ